MVIFDTEHRRDVTPFCQGNLRGGWAFLLADKVLVVDLADAVLPGLRHE